MVALNKDRIRAHRALALAFLVVCLPAFLTAPSALAATKETHAMGDVPCSWNVPIERDNHELDVAATIRLLKANHFSCYVQPIEEHSPMAYQDFLNLLPAAQAGGIEVWAVLIPHTEGFSLPHRENFIRWMQELAKLSLKYSALRGVNIDDIDAGGNDQTFTRSYVCEIDRAKLSINPKLLFVPTIYDLDQEEADRYAGCVDGVWLWWVNLEQNNGLRAFIRNARAVTQGRFPVYAGVYAHSTSWHKQVGPKPEILRTALEIACEYSDGVIVWQLPLGEGGNPWLEVVREFTSGGSSEFAGGCGGGVN